MNLKKVTVSETDIKILISIALVLILSFFCFFLIKNSYYVTLFFPSNSYMNKLLAEKRELIWKKSEKDKISNLVEEILIGPMNKKSLDSTNQNSKLLNLLIENNRVIVNLNRESLNFIKYGNVDNYDRELYLFIYSITNSICFNFNSIKYVKFYFDGILYEYLGNNFQGKDGFSPNWTLLY
jgi:spore germination protein GerM